MNKFMKDYLENVNSEKENLNTIKNRIIQKNQQKRKLINLVAVVLIIILLGTCSPKIYAKVRQSIKYQEYTRRDYVSGTGKIASAYTEEIDMDYVYQNNIGVKIGSIILTDDAFKAKVSLKLPEEMRVDKLPENNNEDTHILYSFGYAVYDEKNNIYGCNARMDEKFLKEGYGDYLMCLCKELGIKYKENNFSQLSNGGSMTVIETDDEKVTVEMDLLSLEGFPNSEKLFIRIFNIGYSILSDNPDSEFSEHNDLEWIFEIETPDKFLKRETTNLVLLDEIPKLKISKFIVTETGMTLKAQKKDVVSTMAARKRYGKLGRGTRCFN